MQAATVLGTKLPKIRNKNVTNCRSDDLIGATLDHWSELPEGSMSVRRLTALIGAPGSSIDYHFGGIEQLYVEASRRALGLAWHWMQDVLADLAYFTRSTHPAVLVGQTIALVLDQWVREERRLAMAWRRTKTLASSPQAAAVRQEWHFAWADFWSELSETLGMRAQSGVIAAFADGEACRHLLQWKPLLDTNLLYETAGSLISWLCEGKVADDACRLAYRKSVSRCFGSLVTDADCNASEFGHAAAKLLAREGRSGVTFRAVAEEAGSTLGAVSHHFGSKADLLRTALYLLYKQEAMPVMREELAQHQVPPATMLAQSVSAMAGGTQPVLRAYDEIELAIYNDAAFEGLRAAVRCMNDPSGTWALTQMLGGRVPSQSLVAAYSSVCRGAGHLVENIDLSIEDREECVRAALLPFCLS